MKKNRLMLAALLGLFASTGIANAELQMENGVYLIDSNEDLKEFSTMAETNGSLSAKLTENIVATDAMTPIGGDTPYTGTFDGAGHTISNLSISPKGDVSGLFGYAYGATIKNLTLKNATISGGGSSSNSGGIVGSATNTTITMCGFEGTVTSTSTSYNSVGGICGYASDGEISYCYAIGATSGGAQAAGIVSLVENNTTVKNCYASVEITNATSSYKITHAQNTDCYYLNDVHNESGAATAEEFKSGKIAFSLNSGNEASPFRQNLGTEDFPTITGEYIVYAYNSCSGEGKFTNNAGMSGTTESHDMTEHAANAPTCTQNGNYAYWTCTRELNVFFKDANGDSKFDVAKDTIHAATGHDMTGYNEELPTCTKKGNHAYYICGYEGAGIRYKDKKGENAYASIEDSEIAAKGHHLQKRTVSAQYCTEGGPYVYWQCTTGYETFSDEKGLHQVNVQDVIADLTNHNWGEWVYIQTEEPNHKDTYVRYCTTNVTHTDSVWVDHEWGDWVKISDTPAKEVHRRTCSSSYGSHTEDKIYDFKVENAKYYSQATGSFRDTLMRAETTFKPSNKSKNDLLFMDSTATSIKGSNVIVDGICEKLVITDGYAFNAPVDSTFTAETLEYTRAFGENDYASFVVPFDVPTSELNAYAYRFSNATTNTVTFSLINKDTIKAGTPCILQRVGTEEKVLNTLSNVRITPCNPKIIAIGNFTYAGSFRNAKVDEDLLKDLYKNNSSYICGFLGTGSFQPALVSLTVGAFRCTLKVLDANNSKQPSIGIIFDDENEGITGVATIDADGNLSIDNNVDVYDVMGRLVRKNAEFANSLQGLKKGVYVVNGEKFVKTTDD